MLEAPALETNIWQPFKDRGVMVFAMNRFSYKMAQDWITEYELSYPVLYDPPPSDAYWSYAHQVLPQNTLTDRNFEVIFDQSAGYDEEEIIERIEEHLAGSSEQVVAGDDFAFDAQLKNWGDSAHSFDAWIDVILPGHRRLPNNPRLGPLAITLGAGQTWIAALSLSVPARTPAADNYRIKLSIGSFGADEIRNCDLIEVDVVAGDRQR